MEEKNQELKAHNGSVTPLAAGSNTTQDSPSISEKTPASITGKKATSDKTSPSIPEKDKSHERLTQPGELPSYNWKLIGSWDLPVDLKVTHKAYLASQDFVVDHFYGDWYYNTALPVGVSFFAYIFARYGCNIWWLGFIFLCAVSVYKAEFRRFNRNVRDDILRVKSSNRLEDELETMEWMNLFLSKFWVIYMPALSDLVLFQANEVMKDQAPGFGIEAISLDKFTLGSKAPRIDSIKSFSRNGQNNVEMIWSFSFTPNNTDDMTGNEIRKKISPRVALGVTIGKAFILKSLPILVEDMSCTGRLKVKLNLTDSFPHVKIVSIQFLEPPVFDYALKPVGGETFGIDIMSFIPGLSSFVNGLIHSTLRPMFYAPNSFDIDVAEIMAQQSNDSVGVLIVKIKRITNLKSTSEIENNEINPYVQLGISNNPSICEKTRVKKNTTDPVFSETFNLLINTLNQNNLTLSVFHMVHDKMLDTPLGIVTIPLAEFLQKEIQTDKVSNILDSGKVVGKLEYDMRWYPAIPDEILEDGTKERNIDEPVGIMKLSLFGAADLDTSKSVIGVLDPYAEVYVNDELIKVSRKLQKTNEPSFSVTFESLITLLAETSIQVIVKEASENQIVARLDINLQDLVFESSRGQQWITAPPTNKGGRPAKFQIGAKWTALPLENEESSLLKSAPIGGLRLHIREASELINLEAVGQVDPYVKVIQSGKLKAKTNIIASTLSPYFNQVFYLPVANEFQHVLLDILDAEPEGKDRPLGSCAISVKDFLKKSPDGYYLGYEGSEEIILQPVLFQGKRYGTLSYSVSFFPNIPVFTKAQLENVSEIEKNKQQKEQERLLKQKKDEETFKNNPGMYEWVELQEDIIPEPEKVRMPLDKAIKYRSGTILVKILEGQFNKSDYYVHTLFDDNLFPAGVSSHIQGHRLTIPMTAEAFMRDLPNSRIVFRLSKKKEVEDEKDVSCEKNFHTLDLLKRSFKKPLTINLNTKNKIKILTEFFPSAVKLPPLDTVLDVGTVTLDILSANALPSVDSNGKSDPFCVVKLDGIEIYRTDKQRRTLQPVWNDAVSFPMLSRSRQLLILEIYDWDLTHDDELLGLANLDLSLIIPNNSTQVELQLDTKGTVLIRATFKPEFIRPMLNQSTGLNIDLNAVTKVPLKVVGGAAGIAGNAVGTGIALVSDGVSIGGSFLKGITKSKKNSDLASIKSKPGPKIHRSSKDILRKHLHNSPRVSLRDHDDELSTLAATLSLVSRQMTADETNPLNHTMEFIESGDENTSDQDDNHKTAPSAQEQREQHIPTSVKNAIPNMVPDLLPPPQGPRGFNGHSRNISESTNNTIISTLSRTDQDVPGRINIISLKGFHSGAYSIKATLKRDSSSKDIYKTKTIKADRNGVIEFKEQFVFLAPTNALLILHVREHHSLGRKQRVSLVDLHLSHFVCDDSIFTQPAGDGELEVKLTYGTKPTLSIPVM